MDAPLLLLSAATGTGHMRAAAAVRQGLAAHAPEMAVEEVELLSIAPRWVRAFYGSMFEAVVTRAPRVWGEIYRMTDGYDQDRARWGPLARRLLFAEFRQLLMSRRWSACVSTHFLPCQLAAARPGFPRFGLVVTDFEMHRVWAQPAVDRCFVATDTLGRELARRVPYARVHATGIPISPAFTAAPSMTDARRALGLSMDRPIVLVMGGGLGIGVEEAVAAALEAADPAVQIVAVCGRNEGARIRLASCRASDTRLRVFGQVSGMERFIAAADLVATKPGGLTVSETLALGKPLLLTRPIPGAEEGNLRAVVAEGAALGAFTPGEMRHAFARAFADPAVLERLSAQARRVGRPDSARAIAEIIRREYGAAAVA